MSSASTSSSPRSIHVRLLIPQHYQTATLSEYSITTDLTDVPLSAKSEACRCMFGSPNINEVKMIFRGRILSLDEENIPYQNVMKKFNIDDMEDTLVFHLNVKPAANEPVARSSPHGISRVVLSNEASSSTGQTMSTSPRQEPHAQQPIAVSPFLLGTTPVIPMQVPQPDSDMSQIHGSIQATAAGWVPAQPGRSSTFQLIPVQYQAAMINGEPYLLQIAQPPPPRPLATVSAHNVLPVLNETGQPHLLVSPEGVQQLRNQGYFSRNLRQGDGQARPIQFTREQIEALRQQARQGLGIAGQQQWFTFEELIAWVGARGTQLWLGIRLALVVGLFSSNASWGRIITLILVAGLIFFWQTGAFDNLARILRRRPGLIQVPPTSPGHVAVRPTQNSPQSSSLTTNTGEGSSSSTSSVSPSPTPALVAPATDRPAAFRESYVSAATMALQFVEHCLFVFVASLIPNAIAGDNGNPLAREVEQQGQGNGEQQQQQQRDGAQGQND